MLTPEQIKKYTSGWKKRLKAKEVALQLKHESALKKAGEMARVLKDKYGIEKVILFGSAINGKFWEHSDLDLAVYGLDEERYLDIAWELAKIALPFKVDLIPVERASERLLRKIEEGGEEI